MKKKSYLFIILILATILLICTFCPSKEEFQTNTDNNTATTLQTTHDTESTANINTSVTNTQTSIEDPTLSSMKQQDNKTGTNQMVALESKNIVEKGNPPLLEPKKIDRTAMPNSFAPISKNEVWSEAYNIPSAYLDLLEDTSG